MRDASPRTHLLPWHWCHGSITGVPCLTVGFSTDSKMAQEAPVCAAAWPQSGAIAAQQGCHADAGIQWMHLLDGKLCPQVTASHHGAVNGIQDLLQVHNTVSALYLGKDANAGACRHSEDVVSRPADHALQVEGQSSRLELYAGNHTEAGACNKHGLQKRDCLGRPQTQLGA